MAVFTNNWCVSALLISLLLPRPPLTADAILRSLSGNQKVMVIYQYMIVEEPFQEEKKSVKHTENHIHA